MTSLAEVDYNVFIASQKYPLFAVSTGKHLRQGTATMAMKFNPKVKAGHHAKLDASTVSGIVKIVHVNEHFILIEGGLCGATITMQVRWSEINKINRMIPRKGRK